ncbi:MAG: DUF5686 family protein [Prolixibacteraceae bacterium]
MQKYRLSPGYFAMRNMYVAILLLFTQLAAVSQPVTVSGSVTDARTGEPVPYVSIVFKHTTVGTITDSLGVFTVTRPANADTLHFSAIGYHSTDRVLPGMGKVSLSVILRPETFDISEIEVAPDDGPVRRLLQKIIDNKEKNDPDRHNRYSYRKYTRWEYQINHIDEKIINSRAFRDNQSVFQTDSDSSRFLPLYLSEQLVFNEVQKDPAKQRSTVIADKTNGVGILDDLEISGYTSALDIEVNYYKNHINLFTQNFISPVAENGWFYYQYFLADSAVVDGHKQYRVHFQPRRQGENTFKGYFITEDRHYSIVEIDGRLSSTMHINFLKSLRLKSFYAFVDGSAPFYKKNEIEALFDIIPFKTNNPDKKRLSVYYKQTANIDQVSFGHTAPIELSTPKARYETIYLPDAYGKDPQFWEQNRMEEMSEKQRQIEQIIDSISQIRIINLTNNLARMTMTGYYDIGKFELGPYSSFFNTNKVEDKHFFFGGRTSTEISERMMFWGGLGYGTRTKKIDGMAGFGYKFNSPHRRVLELAYDDKMIRHGENEKILHLYENLTSATENNLISQLLKHDELDEIFREQRYKASYEHEWYTGLQHTFSGSYTRHYSPEFYPFLRNNIPDGSVSAFEVSLDTRLSKEEKFVDEGFLRIFLETPYPIVHFTMAGGKIFYDNRQSWYGRLAATVKQEVFFGQSELDYAVESGIYFGKLPYTMLDIPRGNETLGYYTYDFNMLNYLEFVHDKYIHTFVEYHLNGFFFRRIPLLKKTDLREVFSAKMMVGSVSDKHQEVIAFPSVISKMENPYIELGAGIENIFRMFRVEAIWRLNSTSVAGAPSFGLRAKFELGL